MAGGSGVPTTEESMGRSSVRAIGYGGKNGKFERRAGVFWSFNVVEK